MGPANSLSGHCFRRNGRIGRWHKGGRGDQGEALAWSGWAAVSREALVGILQLESADTDADSWPCRKSRRARWERTAEGGRGRSPRDDNRGFLLIQHKGEGDQWGGRAVKGVWAVDQTNPGGPGSEHADAWGSGILKHVYLASSLLSGLVRGSSQDWRVALCQQLAWMENMAGARGLWGRLRKLVCRRRWTVSCRGQTSLPPEATPSAGAHAPRRCRVSDHEGTGSMIFDFLNNEKCTCRSDGRREAMPAEWMPYV